MAKIIRKEFQQKRLGRTQQRRVKFKNLDEKFNIFSGRQAEEIN
jgi:hypothetical protein